MPRPRPQSAWTLRGVAHTFEYARCHRETSVTAGTIVHGSKLVLTVCVWAACLMAIHSNGISALQLQKQLGIEGQNLTPELKKQIGAKAKKGVVITNILPDSPAALAGLRRGDVIVEANRKAVADTEQLREALKKGENKGNLLVVERQGTTFYVALEGKG